MKPAILAITTASLLMLPGCVSLGLGDESQDVGDGLGDALLTPIDDLNLRDREVPAALTAFDNAYQLNADYRIDGELDCDAIDGEIAKLSAVLGADPDALALAAQADEVDGPLKEKFITGLMEHARAIRDFIEAIDAGGLMKELHIVKGAGGNFGYQFLSDIANEALQSLRRGETLHGISGSLDLLNIIQDVLKKETNP